MCHIFETFDWTAEICVDILYQELSSTGAERERGKVPGKPYIKCGNREVT